MPKTFYAKKFFKVKIQLSFFQLSSEKIFDQQKDILIGPF